MIIFAYQARDFGFPPMKTERRVNVIITDDLVLPSNSMNKVMGNDEIDSHVIIVIIVASVLSVTIFLNSIIVVVRCKRKRKVSTV